MNLTFTVGDLTIHRIIEQETTFLPALDLFPQLRARLTDRMTITDGAPGSSLDYGL